MHCGKHGRNVAPLKKVKVKKPGPAGSHDRNHPFSFNWDPSLYTGTNWEPVWTQAWSHVSQTALWKNRRSSGALLSSGSLTLASGRTLFHDGAQGPRHQVGVGRRSV